MAAAAVAAAAVAAAAATPVAADGQPSNLFSLPRKSISSKTGGATVSVKLPGPGKLEMVGTARVQTGGSARVSATRTIKVGRVVADRQQSGHLRPDAEAERRGEEGAAQERQPEGVAETHLHAHRRHPATTTTSLTLKLRKQSG